MKRITVQGFFEDKQVSELQYVNEWLAHAAQFNNLSWSNDWQDKVISFKEAVALEAAHEFNRLYEAQNEG